MTNYFCLECWKKSALLGLGRNITKGFRACRMVEKERHVGFGAELAKTFFCCLYGGERSVRLGFGVRKQINLCFRFEWLKQNGSLGLEQNVFIK